MKMKIAGALAFYLCLTTQGTQAHGLQQFDGGFLTINPTSDEARPAHILRVQKDLYAHWTGVRHCGDTSDVQRNMKKSFEAWYQQVVTTHHAHVVGRGIDGQANVTTNSWHDAWPSNADHCSGNVTMVGYVDFDADHHD